MWPYRTHLSLKFCCCRPWRKTNKIFFPKEHTLTTGKRKSRWNGKINIKSGIIPQEVEWVNQRWKSKTAEKEKTKSQWPAEYFHYNFKMRWEREEKTTGDKIIDANRMSHQHQCVAISNYARAWKCNIVGLLNYFSWQRHFIISIRYISVYLYINHLQRETPHLTDTNRHSSDEIYENPADISW